MIFFKKRLTDPVEYIWSDDPALNKRKKSYNFAKYLASGDAKHLPLKEGENPTVFYLAPLSRLQRVKVDQLLLTDGEVAGMHEAVAFGLCDIKGSDIDLEFVDTQSGRRLSPGTLDTIYDTQLFLELGGRIHKLSVLDPLSGGR